MTHPTHIVPNIDRVPLSRAEVQANYDRLSGWYDLLAGVWEKQAREAGLRQFEAKAGERLLEIGPGTGPNLAAMAGAVGASGRVYGLDLSPRMIGVAQARLERAGLRARVSLTQGDAANLPFTDGAFDGIFMSFVLELFDTPEIPQVLAECRRVLHPRRGRIGIVSLTNSGRSTWLRRLYRWGHRHFPHLLDCRPIYVRRSLAQAGYHIVATDRGSLWGLPVEIVLARR